jgi:hypothetical protein
MNESTLTRRTLRSSLHFVSAGPQDRPARPTQASSERYGLGFPRRFAPVLRHREPLAALSPAVIHVQEAVQSDPGLNQDRALLAQQRDAILRAREELRAEILKLMNSGWDSAARVNLVHKLDAEIAELHNARPADIGKQEALEHTRRETVQQALDSMADRARAGELLAPASSTFPLRTHDQRQLAIAQLARQQRHTVLKLSEADAAARDKIEALDRRMIELELQKDQAVS